MKLRRYRSCLGTAVSKSQVSPARVGGHSEQQLQVKANRLMTRLSASESMVSRQKEAQESLALDLEPRSYLKVLQISKKYAQSVDATLGRSAGPYCATARAPHPGSMGFGRAPKHSDQEPALP